MIYNQFYDFVVCLGLDFSESVYHDGTSILDLTDLDLQVQENESNNTLDYYDNMELCNMAYGVSLEQLQNIVLDRMGVLL